jgi:hypothetical protein
MCYLTLFSSFLASGDVVTGPRPRIFVRENSPPAGFTEEEEPGE